MSGRDKIKRIRFWHQAPWSWLFSLKTGLVLLAFMVIVSGVTTFRFSGNVPQELGYADSAEAAVAEVFGTWWFVTLLAFLALNLTLSTIRMVYERILHRPLPELHSNVSFYEGRQPTANVACERDVSDVAARFEQAGYTVRCEGAAGVVWKGRAGLWGAVISHLGLVMVILGGMLAAVVMEAGYLTLFEGDTVDSIKKQDSEEEIPLGFDVKCEDFFMDYYPGTGSVSLYRTELYLPGLELSERLQAVEVNKPLTVNGWTMYQSSYQALPGFRRFVVEGLDREFEIAPGQRRHFIDDDKLTTVTLGNRFPYGWWIERDGTETESGMLFDPQKTWRIRVDQYEPDLYLNEAGQVASRSREPNNPGAVVTFLEGMQPVERRILYMDHEMAFKMNQVQMNRPESLPLMASLLDVKNGNELVLEVYKMEDPPDNPDDAKIVMAAGQTEVVGVASDEDIPDGAIRFKDFSVFHVTHLRVARNPVLPAIYLGCALMMLGLLWSFAVPRVTIWFWRDENNGRLRVAARYRYARETFDRRTRKTIESLTDASNNATAEESE